MKIWPSRIPDVLIVEPDRHRDARGYFMETWHRERYAAQGLDVDFVQDNQSHSTQGALRGLHYQLHTPQGKLVHVVRGTIFSVAVDIRVGSPTFGEWVGIDLDDREHHQCYVPPGFAYGYCARSEHVDVVYKCTRFYNPDDEYGIIWNDPAVGIEWPEEPTVISPKDAANPTLDGARTNLPAYVPRR